MRRGEADVPPAFAGVLPLPFGAPLPAGVLHRALQAERRPRYRGAPLHPLVSAGDTDAVLFIEVEGVVLQSHAERRRCLRVVTAKATSSDWKTGQLFGHTGTKRPLGHVNVLAPSGGQLKESLVPKARLDSAFVDFAKVLVVHSVGPC